MSEGEFEIPPQLRGGVFANDAEVYGDLEELTIDFVRRDPRESGAGVLVARVAASRWCILKLRAEFDRRVQ